MLDYVKATQLYEGRKDKHLGRKIRNHIYMKHDPARDCFVVSELWSKYESVPDPDHPGQIKYQQAPKERWNVRPFAEVYRDRIIITRAIHNSPMYALFHVKSFASRTVKLLGRTWIYKNSAHNHQKIHGDLPIMIKDDKLSSPTPPKVRVVDNEKRKEMNRMIQKVRNLLKVRAKLGAFQNVDIKQIYQKMNLKYGNKWRLYRTHEGFLKILRAVREDDIESFYPILWLADVPLYTRRSQNTDWVENYNRFISRMRERLRKEMGVVEYVEETQHE